MPSTRTRPASWKSLEDRLSLAVTWTPKPAGTHTASEPRLVFRSALTLEEPSRITNAEPRFVETLRLPTCAPVRST